MIVYWTDPAFDSSVFAGASVAFGVFDGIHRGHQYLIDQAVKTAKADHAPCIILTFNRDPDEVFRPESVQKLMSNELRLKALNKGDVTVVVLPFSPDLYTLEPEEFLQLIINEHVPAHLHVGQDIRFGAQASGTVDTLLTWGNEAGVKVHAHDLLAADGQPITATRIRKLLQEGQVQEAAALLGHPYTLCGVVQKGRGQGTGFGFATANLHVPQDELVAADGVYAGYAYLDDSDGQVYKAALSVGVSPTFKDKGATANVEVHLFDFEGDLVGRTLCVELVSRLRPLYKFDSQEELMKHVKADIDWIRENL